jgi:hypothetical protein
MSPLYASSNMTLLIFITARVLAKLEMRVCCLGSQQQMIWIKVKVDIEIPA